MSDDDATPDPPADGEAARAWDLLLRRSTYLGEIRRALLRLVAIAAFYAIELLAEYGRGLGFLQLADRKGLPEDYHLRITLVVAAWVMLSVGTLVLVRGRAFSPVLSYVTTTIDVVMLSGVLIVAGGPGSPAVLGYFVLLAMSILRCRLSLVWFTTGAAIAGYVCVVGAAWLVSNPAPGEPPPFQTTVPRYDQLMTVVALGITGSILAAFLGIARSLPDDYLRFRELERRRTEARP